MTSINNGKSVIPLKNKYDRVIMLVDMDCFFCQVEEKLNPTLQGKPVAVVQHNTWKDGGIIAVNYPARHKGVTRHMRGEEAKKLCPDIKLVRVPAIREKADLSKYREAGKEVALVLQRFSPLMERASVDEAYLDITVAVSERLKAIDEASYVIQPTELINTYAIGYNSIGEFINKISKNYANPEEQSYEAHQELYSEEGDLGAVRSSDLRLLVGASIASEVRKAIKAETGYECSAGIAHNKILAKLAAGFNKPNKQTLVPLTEIKKLFDNLPVHKIKGLGGKFGEDVCQQLKVTFLGEIRKYTLADLHRKFEEKNGSWLYHICRGIDLDPVVIRFYAKSIGCCKKFPGRHSIAGLNTLQHWLTELAKEISERLSKDISENNRRARQMVVGYIQEFEKQQEISSSRSVPLLSYNPDMIVKQCMELIQSNTRVFLKSHSQGTLNNPIKYLSISVGKFESIVERDQVKNVLKEMFENQALKKTEEKNDSEHNKYGKQKDFTEEHVAIDKDNKIKKTTDNKLKNMFAQHMKKNTKEQQQTIEVIDEKINIVSSSINIACSIEKFQKTKKNLKEYFLKQQLKKEDEIIAEALSSHMIEEGESNRNRGTISEEVSKLEEKQESNLNLSEPKLCKEEFQFGDICTNPKEDNSEDSQLQDSNIITEADINKLNEESTALGPGLFLSPPHLPREIFKIQEKPPSNKRRKLEDQKRFRLTEGNGTDARAVPSYLTEYAEYGRVNIPIEILSYITCDTCQREILNSKQIIQEHQDYHYAQEIGRMQSRDVLQSRTESDKHMQQYQQNSAKPPHPSLEITAQPRFSKKSKTSNQSGAIERYFRIPSETPGEDEFLCDNCNKIIKIVNKEEHMDYHMAKDLQRDLCKLENSAIQCAKASRYNTKRTIDTFFKQY